MIVKIDLRTMQDAKNLVHAVATMECDVDLISGRYVVDAKSLPGIFSLPDLGYGELRVHTDDPQQYRELLERLRKFQVLVIENKSASKPMYDIAALGEILIDFTYQGRNEQGQSLFARNPGGAPANVSVAAAKLGARTAFIGKAGDDMHGRFLKQVLQHEGVDSSGLLLDSKYFTTLAFVDLDENGERTFSFARKPGADIMLEKDDINLEILRNSSIFHFGSLSLTGEPARSTTYYAVNMARASGCIVSYDPNYRAPLWKNADEAARQMRSMVPFVDIIKIAAEEAALLTDEANPEKAAAVLLDRGVKVAVVTLGEKGAYIRCESGDVTVPACRGKVVDTTGAGDTFWGTFLYQMSRSGKTPESVTISELVEFTRLAHAAAALCIASYGAIPAMPDKNAALELAKQTYQDRSEDSLI